MIYNIHNEIVCDYNCDACNVAEDCTDRIDKNKKNIDILKQYIESQRDDME